MRTKNKDVSFREELTEGTLGLAGETGEVIDIVKKVLFQGHTMSVDKLKEELSDTLWYIVHICDTYGFTLEHIAELNINKLKERYPEGFTPKDSINRMR